MMWKLVTTTTFMHHLQDLGQENIQLHLGKVAGDITRIPLAQLQRPVDFLVAGPPCPPWAGQGVRRGYRDPKAKAFMAVLSWVAYLVATGGLLGEILENVLGLRRVMREVRAVLKKCGAFFIFVANVFNSSQVGIFDAGA